MDYDKLLSSLGDFTIFGFSTKPLRSYQSKPEVNLPIVPSYVDFGDKGHFFYYSTYAQIAESKTNILIKVGFARSRSHSPLSSQQILDKKLIGLESVEVEELSGNALVACLSKIEPRFSAYKTLMAVPQLYYSSSETGIICSDRLKALCLAKNNVELYEDAVAMHFLFRTVIGPATYFRGISRMLPGQFMSWNGSDPRLRLVHDLQFHERASYHRIDSHNLNELYASLRAVINDYQSQAGAVGDDYGNLLSGGVDSSLVQCILNEDSRDRPKYSFSFAPEAPCFSFEIDYARIASQHFGTKHTYVGFSQHDYPELLEKTIDDLAYPPLLPSEPAIGAIARHLQTGDIPIRFYFSGQGAESTFGYPIAKKIKVLQCLSHIPFSSRVIKSFGRSLELLHPYGHVLSERASKIRALNDENTFLSPLNTFAVYCDWNRALKSFGEKVVRENLQYRRDLAAQYISSPHLLERLFVLDMVTDSYDVAAERNQIFLGSQREILHPFLDEDVIRAGFRFDPDIRYLKGFKEKYLLKAILLKRSGLRTVWKPKGAAQFFDDFYEWMRTGSLRPLVEDIERPGFISQTDFEMLAKKPDIFLWSLLVLDIFKKRVLKSHLSVTRRPADA